MLSQQFKGREKYIATILKLTALLFSTLLFTGISFGATFVSLHDDIGERQYGFGVKVTDKIPNFKVFIPPGTTKINMRIFCVNDANNMYAVSRYKAPPENYGVPPTFESGKGYTLDQLQSDNRFSLNPAGLVRIIMLDLKEPVTVNESGWLYVRILGGWDVKSIKYDVYFDGDIYNKWYKSIDWFSDVDLGGVYVPPTNDTPTTNPDPPVTDPPVTDKGDDSDIYGTPVRDSTPTPSTGGTDRQSGCTNILECLLDGAPTTDNETNNNDSNPFNPGDSSNGDNKSNTDSPASNEDSAGDQAGTVDPAFSIMCGSNTQREITADDLEGRTIAIPRPWMTTDGISESLEYFAMITVGPKMFMAVKDELHPTIISFIEYIEGDRLRSYKKGPLAMSSYWICDVFDETLFDLGVPVQMMAQYDVHFVCGYAPEGEVDNGNFQNLKYVDLWFSPSLK